MPDWLFNVGMGLGAFGLLMFLGSLPRLLAWFGGNKNKMRRDDARRREHPELYDRHFLD